MVILIAGGSHTGKTLLAQRLLERHHYPYLSIDHLKMGLISLAHGNCERAGYWFKNGCNIANGIVKKMACRWNATPWRYSCATWAACRAGIPSF